MSSCSAPSLATKSASAAGITTAPSSSATTMSPKMPAPSTPMASATTTQFSGMASIALRVEIGFDQLSGVARSSRTGTKRSVKAGPTTRFPEKPKGMAPAIQERRMPFFSSMVVMVPVVTLRSVSSVDVIDSSRGFQAEPLVAAAQIGDEWGGQQHHPELADDLAEQEVERAEGQPQEHDRVDDQADRLEAITASTRRRRASGV